MKNSFDDEIMMEVHQIEPKKIKPLGMNINYFAMLLFGVFGLLILLGNKAVIDQVQSSFVQFDWYTLADNTKIATSVWVGSLVVVGYSIYTAFQNLFRLG